MRECQWFAVGLSEASKKTAIAKVEILKLCTVVVVVRVKKKRL
jgi:hypothetical protein